MSPLPARAVGNAGGRVVAGILSDKIGRSNTLLIMLADIGATVPATTECWNLHATCSPNAQVTAAGFFVYGATEADAPANCTVQGLKQSQTAPWASVGGSAAAIAFAAAGSAATQDYYFGLTITPTANGALTGTLKCSMTFV